MKQTFLSSAILSCDDVFVGKDIFLIYNHTTRMIRPQIYFAVRAKSMDDYLNRNKSPPLYVVPSCEICIKIKHVKINKMLSYRRETALQGAL